MSFLSVVLAYVLARFSQVASWLQRDGWFESLLATLGRRYPGSRLPFIVMVPGIALLGWLMVHDLSFMAGFLLTVLVLLYCLGRGRWRDYSTDVMRQLEHGQAEAVWLALESEGSLERGSGDALWMGIRRHAAYSLLHDLFGVFFWFCLLGPAGIAGALLFRLIDLYNLSASQSPAILHEQTRWQRALEWLPARYLALCFCLAGNFTSCFWVWRQLLLDTQVDTRDFLCRCLDAALVIEEVGPLDSSSAEAEQVAQALRYGRSLQDLLARTEIIGLAGIALVVLVMT